MWTGVIVIAAAYCAGRPVDGQPEGRPATVPDPELPSQSMSQGRRVAQQVLLTLSARAYTYVQAALERSRSGGGAATGVNRPVRPAVMVFFAICATLLVRYLLKHEVEGIAQPQRTVAAAPVPTQLDAAKGKQKGAEGD